MEYLVNKRRTRIEEVKFENVRPYSVKMEYLRHSEEMLAIYNEVGEYFSTAKNLAYKLVYDAIWWPPTNTDEYKFNKFLNMLTEYTVSDEDQSLIDTAIGTFDLTALSAVVDKYVSYDSSKHMTIKELAMTPEYNKLYVNVYNEINKRLDTLPVILEADYDKYLEERPGSTVTMDEYLKMVKMPAGVLLKGIGVEEYNK